MAYVTTLKYTCLPIGQFVQNYTASVQFSSVQFRRSERVLKHGPGSRVLYVQCGRRTELTSHNIIANVRYERARNRVRPTYDPPETEVVQRTGIAEESPKRRSFGATGNRLRRRTQLQVLPCRFRGDPIVLINVSLKIFCINNEFTNLDVFFCFKKLKGRRENKDK